MNIYYMPRFYFIRKTCEKESELETSNYIHILEQYFFGMKINFFHVKSYW